MCNSYVNLNFLIDCLLVSVVLKKVGKKNKINNKIR